MKKKEVEKLIGKIVPGTDIKVTFKSKKEMDNWTATVIVDEETIELHISRSEFTGASEQKTMAILLHELGHTQVQHSRYAWKNEYNAQEWAIKKAQELKLNKIKYLLLADILSWGTYKWNEDRGRYRSYILASKEFMKRRINWTT